MNTHLTNIKKKLSVKYNTTMSSPMPFIVIGGMMCLSSSVGAALMMGGGEEDKTGTVCTPEGTPDPNATYKYGANDACVMTCKTGYIKEDGACVEEKEKEVFHIGGYTYSKGGAEAGCAEYDAELATDAQLTAAYEAGANWCSSGWLSDTDVGAFPITEEKDFRNGCGGTSAGIRRWNRTSGPEAGKSGLNCYGVKPDEGTEKVYRFNTSKWSRYE
jgi:hypothetical protein